MNGWSPFKELNEIQSRLSSLLGRDTGGAELAAKADWAPAVDISEDDNEYFITADLPEVSKEDVNVTVEDGVLTLSGERRHESEEKDEKKK